CARVAGYFYGSGRFDVW
nr:immunoglobulin heavy chain junction region [Macaca mulatta]MOV38775.1 immunoglobulin heavy chain junction region [Macaca mulatta]MOV39939.1 immunoglobulin heavy chain junction region [Macaca mulatta]MOV40519.1 immunoglobulin heavy chain junction region [Macaca mulatta]MOV40636.1 immunoglobulin heavy chain junction region [Macaca mulatta]